jgi:hypothetical protein
MLMSFLRWILWLYVPLTFYPSQPSHSPKDYLLNYALISPLIMNQLFIASTCEWIWCRAKINEPPNPAIFLTVFSEHVSSGKYPSYAAYKKRVGMFLPFPDTFIRSFYYNFLASKETKKAVEEEVWGDRPKVKGE